MSLQAYSILFYFYFFPTSQWNLCWDPSTVEYSAFALMGKVKNNEANVWQSGQNIKSSVFLDWPFFLDPAVTQKALHLWHVFCDKMVNIDDT